MADEPRFFTLTEIEGIPEITLGSADFVSRPIIVLAKDEIIQYVNEAKPERLIINFRNVSHISSEFISAMIVVRDHVRGNGGEMKFSHLNETVQTPFRITKLAGRVFPIFETTPQAIDSF